MRFFRAFLAVGVFFAFVATVGIPTYANANGAVVVTAASSGVNATTASAGCNQLAAVDVVYLKRVAYHQTTPTNINDKVYIIDRFGRGISLKEFIERYLPGAKVLCISPDSHRRVFSIWYTK